MYIVKVSGKSMGKVEAKTKELKTNDYETAWKTYWEWVTEAWYVSFNWNNFIVSLADEKDTYYVFTKTERI
jgi:hypothetical protein